MNGKMIALCTALLLLLAGCGKDKDKDEQGLAVELKQLNDDPVSSLHLWVFDANGRELNEYRYSSTAELGGTLLPLPAGKYTFVIATNIAGPLVIEKGSSTDAGNATGSTATTDLARLYIRLTDPSASPAHAHYGVQQATVAPEGVTRVPLTLNRALAEMSFTIKNIPADVQKATLKVTNTAEGFYPGSGKLSAQTATASLGEQTPVGGVFTFATKRIMPVVKPATTDAAESRSLLHTDVTRSGSDRTDAAALKTLLQLTITYTSGTTITFDLEAPVTQSGGMYTPQIEYDILRPGITVQINGINGWTELPSIDGEVLNPSK